VVDQVSPAMQAYLRDYKRLLDSGTPPDEVADAVFSAILDNKFYILPDIDLFKPAVRARMEDILEARNPQKVPLTFSQFSFKLE